MFLMDIMPHMQGPNSPGDSEGAAALSHPAAWMPLDAQVPQNPPSLSIRCFAANQWQALLVDCWHQGLNNELPCQAEASGRRPGGGANGLTGKGRKMVALNIAGEGTACPNLKNPHTTKDVAGEIIVCMVVSEFGLK